MIKCLIVDDDKTSRQVIKTMLAEQFPSLDLSLEAGNVEDAILLTRNHKPKLVFLDINLPDGTGFDYIELVDQKDFSIIFTTGMDSYATKAFRVNAIDYIMKPYVKAELIEAVNKAISKVNLKQIEGAILDTPLLPQMRIRKIALPTSTGFALFHIDDVIRCESDGNYTKFHFTEYEPLLVSKNLGSYEELLEVNGFFRVHASHIVNLNHVRQFSRSQGGYIVLSDGSNIEVSKSKKDKFLEALAAFVSQ